jgi:2-dehydro-3-deoxy-D-arabinonate dehydratase
MMKLYRSSAGAILVEDDRCFALADGWDDLLARGELPEYLRGLISNGALKPTTLPAKALAPVQSQEVWAAGVTYLRSMVARTEESKAHGVNFYDRVYSAPRPELFFKAAGFRVIGPGGHVAIRADSKWNVPEPELTLLCSSTGRITGYTIGNDMSSRDIEGENPLYLPQAKTYDGSCALGPCILIAEEALPKQTAITITIRRQGSIAFEGATALSRIQRTFESLVEYLFRHTSFPHGCFLMTGTGVVPPDDFTLQSGDEIRITIEPIGTLVNIVR